MDIVLTPAIVSAIVPAHAGTLIPFIPFLNATFERYAINNVKRVAMFLAQAIHESQHFTRLVENLNYSADGLRQTWPARFRNVDAAQYHRKPEKIANFVYGGRYGNGNEASGDGWRYRGRGIFQITFRDNYAACGRALGMDLLSNPELLERPQAACLSAGWFWNSRSLNEVADKSDVLLASRRINGGQNGLGERRQLFTHINRVLTELQQTQAPGQNTAMHGFLQRGTDPFTCLSKQYGLFCSCSLCQPEAIYGFAGRRYDNVLYGMK